MLKKFSVDAVWDEEARVWVATSTDIPGLVTEAADLEQLVARVLDVAPELIEDNAHLIDDQTLRADLIDLCIHAVHRLDGRVAY